MVIADTSVWVPFLRSRGSQEHLRLDNLLAQREVAMVGPVLAEILRGARTDREFADLSNLVSGVPYISDALDTWNLVASLSYQLRQGGRTVAMIDLLIAAIALENDCEVYSLDSDFSRIPGLKLYDPAGGAAGA